MNKRRVKLTVLLMGFVTLLCAGSFGLWLQFCRREEALNRQLIAAIVEKDITQALALLYQGADPNLRNQKGKTVLQEVLDDNKRHPDLVSLLRKAGAKQ